jgi:hypothetical protein
VDYNRLFVTGRSSRAEVIPLNAAGADNYSFLGVPTPETAPSASGSATGEDCDARSYVYTYINKFGEESAPSPPSSQISVKDGTSVSVSGIAKPPDGWGVEGVIIYRSATGARMGEDLANPALLTSYYRVVAGAYSASFSDSVRTRHLGIILETEDDGPPPDGLRLIQHLSGTKTLVGVQGNQVRFSSNYEPWNWPERLALTLPDYIVNMVSVDTTIFISTLGRAYVIDGSNVCDPSKGRPILDTDIPIPDVACGHTRSAVATPFGMIFNSVVGLILLKPDATWRIITAPWFSANEWRKEKLDTVRLGYWNGFVFCAMGDNSFVLQIDTDSYGSSDQGQLAYISDHPVDMMTTASGELLMLENNVVWQWNAGAAYRPFKWTSGPLRLMGKGSFNTLKVKSAGVSARLSAPDSSIFYDRYAPDDEPVRLKRLGRHDHYFLTLSGWNPVESAELGVALLGGLV